MAKTIFEKGPSAGEMRAKNPDEFAVSFNGSVRYRPDGQIFIFTTARRNEPVSQQPLFPSTELKGCTDGERYVLAFSVADPVPQACPDLERGGKRIDYLDGWIAAIGLLHPEHPMGGSGDWWTGADQATVSDGVNLIAKGFFPSRTNPPTEEDIRRSESFRNKRYRWLTDQAFQRAAKGSKHLADFMHQHEDVADAMDALGLTADWHRGNRKVMASCPNCGDPVAQGLAFHKSSVTDRLCVIDPERAFKAKAITKTEMEELLTAPAV